MSPLTALTRVACGVNYRSARDCSLSRPHKGTPLRHVSYVEPSCVEIGSVVFAVGDDKNKQESPAEERVTRDSSARMKAPVVKI